METGINWSNAPALSDSPVAALVRTTSGQWREVDVTAAIVADGTYCFPLSNTAADLARYTSRQGTNKPQLVIERGNVSSVPGNQIPVAGPDSFTVTEDVPLAVAAPAAHSARAIPFSRW